MKGFFRVERFFTAGAGFGFGFGFGGVGACVVTVLGSLAFSTSVVVSTGKEVGAGVREAALVRRFR